MLAQKIAYAIDWILDEPNRLEEEREVCEQLKEESRQKARDEEYQAVREQEYRDMCQLENDLNQIGNLPWNQ